MGAESEVQAFGWNYGVKGRSRVESITSHRNLCLEDCENNLLATRYKSPPARVVGRF